MAATIELSRENNRWIDRMRAYKVVIDGQVSGEIRRGETRAFEVVAGRHQLHLTIDWTRSQILDIDVPEEGSSVVRCWSNAHLLTGLYWISFGRARYIDLEVINTG